MILTAKASLPKPRNLRVGHYWATLLMFVMVGSVLFASKIVDFFWIPAILLPAFQLAASLVTLFTISNKDSENKAGNQTLGKITLFAIFGGIAGFLLNFLVFASK